MCIQHIYIIIYITKKTTKKRGNVTLLESLLFSFDRFQKDRHVGKNGEERLGPKQADNDQLF